MQHFQRFRSPNIPLFQCLAKRTIKKQRRRKDNNTLHSKSVNQLSLYGAVADLIKELPDQRAPGKPVALDQMKQEILTQPPLGEVQADV